ncbi:carbohydrate kinase family protein [Dactylosporangium salmoneum]|uniref:Carbohydrate kinase family protein n=1 Tax=Dactylosporangium salmoneum TaxID=53361 RepID=A0ABN3GJI7_9ACTN
MDLVIVGHLGLNDDVTPFGRAVSPGGAGYAVAKGARLLGPGRVGLVARVGPDFDRNAVLSMGVDAEGVTVHEGRSPRFYMRQHADNSREFTADMGTGNTIAPDELPAPYRRARHVHLATAPPQQQWAWLTFLRTLPARPAVSVDMFEHFASSDPALCRSLCAAADLLFMNDEERHILYGDGPLPSAPAVVKHGPLGASYCGTLVPTTAADPVDTTGAGEVLAGVFLALRLAGEDPLPALTAAVRAATAKVTEFGMDGAGLATAIDEIAAHICAA